MIKAVIFDMFETLISYHTCPVYFGAQMAEDAGIPVAEFLVKWRATDYDRSTGKRMVEEVLEQILKEFGCYSEELLKELVGKRCAAIEACLEYKNDEIVPMLQGLKEQGVSIGLISNCYLEEANRIRESELFPFFDAVFFSNEQGICKPEKEIYYRCVGVLSVQPEECLYVGDGGSRELETAQELGMKAVQATWYLKEGTSQPVGRMAEYEQVERPMDVVEFVKFFNEEAFTQALALKVGFNCKTVAHYFSEEL